MASCCMIVTLPVTLATHKSRKTSVAHHAATLVGCFVTQPGSTIFLMNSGGAGHNILLHSFGTPSPTLLAAHKTGQQDVPFMKPVTLTHLLCCLHLLTQQILHLLPTLTVHRQASHCLQSHRCVLRLVQPAAWQEALCDSQMGATCLPPLTTTRQQASVPWTCTCTFKTLKSSEDSACARPC